MPKLLRLYSNTRLNFLELCSEWVLLAMTFMAVIGKQFGDGGPHDLVESGIILVCTVGSVHSGKQYNCFYCHKIVLEAFMWKQRKALEKWLTLQAVPPSLLADVFAAASALCSSCFDPD